MTKQEILVIEENMMREPSVNLQEWSDKKSKLSSILNVKVKGALVRSRFLSVKDMDGPTSFFFLTWSTKVYKTKNMYSLKNSHCRDLK